jgi:hypothetical protein
MHGENDPAGSDGIPAKEMSAPLTPETSMSRVSRIKVELLVAVTLSGQFSAGAGL